jgi:PAS domain S-box-containing protein
VGRLSLPVTDGVGTTTESMFRAAIDACPFGVVLVGPLGKIVLANREVERIFDYTHAELIGQSVDLLVPAKLRSQYLQYYDQLATRPQIHPATNRRLSGQRKDGTEVPVEVGLNLIHISDGVAFIGAIVDITDRLRIEQLNDGFVATVSHELRTPLTSISGALGLLINDAGKTVPKPMMRLLTIAHNNSQRLVRLVNSILDMEKIESGKVVFVLKQVEIRDIVEQAIDANRGFADMYGVRLRLDPASTAGEIRVDPDWLMQILTNLLSNAVKFSPWDSEVVVAIESRIRGVRISVRDHGPGIPEDFKSRIFQKFAQANTSDARQQGGTGLGLSIVRELVTRMGGDVSFDEAPGGGAIFHLDLPGWQPEIAATSEPGAKPDGPPTMTSAAEAQG